MAMGGLVSLPAWANGWTPESIGQVSLLPADQVSLLGDIVETIIPETATPGAKSLNIHQFALRMINDCYGEPAQLALTKGLAAADETARQTYAKDFPACDATQRKDVLNKLAASPDEETRRFAGMIKSLTIQGYMNSEYYLTNVAKYVMAPGFYHGCVPVKSAALTEKK